MNLIKEYTKEYSSNIFRSITTDNGTEFSKYKDIEKNISTLKIQIYNM